MGEEGCNLGHVQNRLDRLVKHKNDNSATNAPSGMGTMDSWGRNIRSDNQLSWSASYERL